VNTKTTGRTFRRCGCRDRKTGRRLGGRCPRLADAGHGSWYLCLELGIGSDGRRCRLRCGGYPSQKAARQALDQLCIPSGGPGGGTGWTTGRWLARWLAGKEGLRPSSVRSYQGHVRLYLVPHLGRIPLRSLTPADLQAMFSTIQRQHAAAGRPVSAATLVRIRATLRSALNAAVREQLITDNPARWVQLPQVRRPHPVIWTGARVTAWRVTGERPAVAVWTAQQTATFLRGIAGDPLYACYHLIALRGLRRGEAAGLAWPQVELDSGEATICQQLQEHSGQPVLLPPKSVASVRTIALDFSTVAALRAHRERQRTEHGLDRPDGFVFARPDGRPYSPGYLTHRFARLVAGLGLPPIRLHDLRHGAATLALASGADLKAIQDMLGHASIVLTADTYASVLPEVARRTADGIARLIVQAGRYPPGSAEMHAQWSQERLGTHQGPTTALPADQQDH
jgi:integrase